MQAKKATGARRFQVPTLIGMLASTLWLTAQELPGQGPSLGRTDPTPLATTERTCELEPNQAQLLHLINQARSASRRCGDDLYPAAQPLRWSCKLESAALTHSRDMAERNYFSHTGADGSTPSERAIEAGYSWRRIGENVAAGQSSPQAVVETWLASPGHCANIMEGSHTETGAAAFHTSSSTYGIYWTMLFARPDEP